LLSGCCFSPGDRTPYVGDSEIDSETARRAGIPFALYTQGYRKSSIEEIHHDWAFDHFDTLTTIVGQAS